MSLQHLICIYVNGAVRAELICFICYSFHTSFRLISSLRNVTQFTFFFSLFKFAFGFWPLNPDFIPMLIMHSTTELHPQSMVQKSSILFYRKICLYYGPIYVMLGASYLIHDSSLQLQLPFCYWTYMQVLKHIQKK